MLGIDVSKETLDCALLNPADRAVLRELKVPNAPAGWQRLLDEIPAETPWVLEPTGRYSLQVAQAATQAGRKVLLAPSRAARLFLASRSTRAKTDRIDGIGLGEFGLSHSLRPYPVKTAHVERLQQLLAVRRRLSGSLMRFYQQRRELPAAAETLDRIIASLEPQLHELDQQLKQVTGDKKTYPAVRLLDRIQGVGPVIAASVAACLQDKQFTHPDQFVAFVGLDLKVHDSGKREGRRGLTKEGPGELRRLLYLAAQANLRCKSSPFKAQYERERAKGLPTTGALCAVARKIAKVCWSVAKYQTKYDPSRVNVQPKKGSTASPQE